MVVKPSAHAANGSAGKDRAKRRKLSASGLLRDITVLMAGAGAAQAIMVLTAPLLSRLYAPAEFAGLALMTSAIGIISRVSSFKYETAIATARNRVQMGALAAVATLILLGFTFASLVVPLLALPVLVEKLGWDDAIAFCIFLPIVVLFDGLIQILITWAVRWKQFATVSSNQVTRNGVSVATQALAGLAGAGGFGLMAGQAVGTIVATAALGLRPTVKDLRKLAFGANSRRRAAVARRFRDFPLYQMPAGVLNSLGRYLPTVLIPFYFGATATGLFFLALRLTALPSQLMSQTLGRVLMQRFATLQNDDRKPLRPLLLKSTAGLFLLAVPMVAIVAMFGDTLFAVFLGKQWAGAGVMATWTVLWAAGTMCGTPAQQSLMVQRKNAIILAVQAAWTLPRLLPFPLFAASGDVVSAVAYSCAAAFCTNVTMIGFAIYYARGKQRARNSHSQGALTS